MKTSHFLALVSLSLAAWVAHAQQENKEHRGPPPGALAACKSAANGAACSFTSPRGAETGTCGAPEGKPLACRPAHGGKPQGQEKGMGPGASKGEKPNS